MINFQREKLGNGLTVLCHTDRSTPFVSVNILYKVGSRNESPERTGFAHLFEHLMFSGSQNVADFDREVQLAGGESNAFTTNDITNYYITIPAANIETALWLESDRMLSSGITQQSLDVQKQVVIEEFKQRYLNTPYGDVWQKLRPLAYKVHPYRWSTIGMSPEHIERASLSDVQDFFAKHYAPNNAVVCLAGNIEVSKAFALVEKWFGEIPPSSEPMAAVVQEPVQTEARRLVTEDHNVPLDGLWRVYHMGRRVDSSFYVGDVISDILSNGQSSRLYQRLVKERGLFASIDASVTGDEDPGLFVFSGKVTDGVSVEVAEKAIDEEIERLVTHPIPERELQKIINKAAAQMSYSEIGYQRKAENLAFFEFLGDASLINHEMDRYEQLTNLDITHFAEDLFRKENSSTMLYLKKK